MERLGILESGAVRPPLVSPLPATQEAILAKLAEAGIPA